MDSWFGNPSVRLQESEVREISVTCILTRIWKAILSKKPENDSNHKDLTSL